MSVNAFLARGVNAGAGMLDAARTKYNIQRDEEIRSRNAFVQDRAFNTQQDQRNATLRGQQEAAEAEHERWVMENVMGAESEDQARALYRWGREDAVRRGFDVSGAPEDLPPGLWQAKTTAAPDLVETVGPDGNPILTPKSEAAGMRPYKAPQKPPNRRVVQVAGPDGKPRFEFEDVAVEQGMTPFVENKPPSADQKKAKANIRRLDTSVETYLKLLDKYGTEGFPGQAKLSLKSAHNDLLLELKELYNLGVLNGPDLDIMTEVLMDPTAIMNQRFSGKEVRQVFDQVVAPKIAAAKNTYSEIYGDTIEEPISDSEYERMKAEAGI